MNELKIKYEKKLLEKELGDWFNLTKEHIRNTPSDLLQQVKLLSTIRKDLYENINQLQHKSLIISTAEYLKKNHKDIDRWTWHPKQTSHVDFADLTGYCGSKIIVNAEVTTSLRPIGTIDTRMAKTLQSLSAKLGLKFYVVQTSEMLARANSKIERQNLPIKAILI